VLIGGWEREAALGRAGVTGAILGALRRLHAAGGEVARVIEAGFLASATPPKDYLLRRSAANWPALAARWGEVYPAEVRYSPQEYRDLANRWLAPAVPERPRILIETVGRGTVELELLGDQAPLTVANFLSLVEEGAYDGGEWHRDVPNFVVQDGAGPRTRPISGLPPIRDEFNPVRYDGPVLGMALSGPDTGTSQWFINLSPQPHLDGGYTVFGRVVGGTTALERILQGDPIRSITRR
jgi:peptidyl-prolyl cis-trans isomerase B (cyclophilin B)